MQPAALNPPSLLSSPVNISKLAQDKVIEFTLNKDQDWLKKILDELNGDAPGIPVDIAFSQTRFNLNLKVCRSRSHEFQEYIVVDGEIDLLYFTQCVKTTVLMKDELQLKFSAIFLDTSFEANEAYQDLTEVFADGAVRELYYFSKRLLDLEPMVNEQIYLNKNPYPTRNI